MNANDKFHEQCGVFGIWGHGEAAPYTAMGLIALQHRGQDSSGIAVSCAGEITRACCQGNCNNLIGTESFKALEGHIAIGHVRYSTVGASHLKNAQPLMIDSHYGQIALSHNGQIVNHQELRKELNGKAAVWATESDTEIALQLCWASSQPTVIDAIVESLGRVRGAYAFLWLVDDEIIAARDPHGIRPLCLGKLGDATVVCSETCALDAVGASYLRDVDPGEIVGIGKHGIRTVRRRLASQHAHCVFEHIYFARPDSYVFGNHVGSVRTRIGRALARESPAPADVIVPIPESSMWAALGYQEESGLPLRMGIIRNAYIGRTFIEPHVRSRDENRRLKLNTVPSVLAGMRVLLVDDSIVRGETMLRIVNMVRKAGATEVHLRIGSPPVIAPCFYGINTPTRSELIAAFHPVEEVREMIGADSLAYLSLQGMLDAVGHNQNNYCTACYTGHYRVAPASEIIVEESGCANPLNIPNYSAGNGAPSELI